MRRDISAASTQEGNIYLPLISTWPFLLVLSDYIDRIMWFVYWCWSSWSMIIIIAEDDMTVMMKMICLLMSSIWRCLLYFIANLNGRILKGNCMWKYKLINVGFSKWLASFFVDRVVSTEQWYKEWCRIHLSSIKYYLQFFTLNLSWASCRRFFCRALICFYYFYWRRLFPFLLPWYDVEHAG